MRRALQTVLSPFFRSSHTSLTVGNGLEFGFDTDRKAAFAGITGQRSLSMYDVSDCAGTKDQERGGRRIRLSRATSR